MFPELFHDMLQDGASHRCACVTPSNQGGVLHLFGGPTKLQESFLRTSISLSESLLSPPLSFFFFPSLSLSLSLFLSPVSPLSRSLSSLPLSLSFFPSLSISLYHPAHLHTVVANGAGRVPRCMQSLYGNASNLPHSQRDEL